MTEAEDRDTKYDVLVKTAKAKQIIEAERDASIDRKIAARKHTWTPDKRLKSDYTGFFAPCCICVNADLPVSDRAETGYSANWAARYTYFAANHDIEVSVS